jgi:hypothetical protein
MGSQILGAQQRPQQVGKKGGGHDAAQDEVEHGASDPVAAGDVGGHQREGSDADAKDKDVDHWWSSCRDLPAVGTSNGKARVKRPFEFWVRTVKSA